MTKKLITSAMIGALTMGGVFLADYAMQKIPQLSGMGEGKKSLVRAGMYGTGITFAILMFRKG